MVKPSLLPSPAAWNPKYSQNKLTQPLVSLVLAATCPTGQQMTPPEAWGANREWSKKGFAGECSLWGQQQPAHLSLFVRQTHQLLTEKLGLLHEVTELLEVLQNKQNKTMTVLADFLACSFLRFILKKEKVSLKFFYSWRKPGNSSHYSLCKVTRTRWVTDLWLHPRKKVPLLTKTFNICLYFSKLFHVFQHLWWYPLAGHTTEYSESSTLC